MPCYLFHLICSLTEEQYLSDIGRKQVRSAACRALCLSQHLGTYARMHSSFTSPSHTVASCGWLSTLTSFNTNRPPSPPVYRHPTLGLIAGA